MTTMHGGTDLEWPVAAPDAFEIYSAVGPDRLVVRWQGHERALVEGFPVGDPEACFVLQCIRACNVEDPGYERRLASMAARALAGWVLHGRWPGMEQERRH